MRIVSSAMGAILKRSALLVLLAACLTGCRLDLRVGMALEPSGGGRLAVALSADAAALERAAAEGADPLGLVTQAGEDLAADGWTVTDTTAGDGTRTVELAVEADDAETLSAHAAQLAGALSGPEATLLEPLTVDVEPERLNVDGVASLLPGDAVADYGLTASEAIALLQERDVLGYTVTVDLPAEVLSSNATTADGSSLTWVVQPGQRVPIAAQGVRPRIPLVPLLAGAAAVLLLILVLFAAARRRARDPGGRRAS